MNLDRRNMKSKMAYVEVGIVAVVAAVIAIAYAVSRISN
jgi:hypothetical protein